jgi:hypothetical protein
MEKAAKKAVELCNSLKAWLTWNFSRLMAVQDITVILLNF